jgi:uncharacterized protein DUF5979
MKVLAVLALAAGVLVALGTPASAGENMHVEVNKVVVGSAPAGTTFTVHYACTDGGPSGDLTFDATGKSVPANDNFFNDGVLGTTCTITETGTGGATTVAYNCQDDGVNASCAASGNEVTFDSPNNTSNNVTFTVTNTFGGASPTPTAPAAQPEPEPATAVAGVPRLTG